MYCFFILASHLLLSLVDYLLLLLLLLSALFHWSLLLAFYPFEYLYPSVGSSVGAERENTSLIKLCKCQCKCCDATWFKLCFFFIFAHHLFANLALFWSTPTLGCFTPKKFDSDFSACKGVGAIWVETFRGGVGCTLGLAKSCLALNIWVYFWGSFWMKKIFTEGMYYKMWGLGWSLGML